jgi:hypothetical protein
MKTNEPRTFSAEAQRAFRQMLYHKVAMWDAGGDLEKLLTCEVDTGQLDYLASGFGPADELLAMDDEALLEIMQDWMSDPEHARFYPEDKRDDL